jgi:hypothetical protein
MTPSSQVNPMKISMPPMSLKFLIGAAALATAGAAAASSVPVPTLTGWALMPAATFADGPTSGQFAAANPYGTNLPPYAAKQPVQGFSGVLRGPGRDTFGFLVDNGFGAKANSADALLRMYTVNLDLRTAHGGSGTVSAADWVSGRPRAAFDSRTRLTLNDAARQIGIAVQADYAHYYDNAAGIPVDPAIRASRLLTGADLDIEAVRRDHRGHYWFGDEFGPYLVKTDAHGTVLRPVIPMPGVYAPENADVLAGTAAPNLGGSGGFEGMAINASGTRLYTLLEKVVAGDPQRQLRISEFDIDAESYTGRMWFYPLDAAGTAIGDMVAVDDERFVVIERNGGTATTPSTTPFKKLFLVDLSDLPSGGTARKTELADLMNLADPHDLDRDGQAVYTLPYVTIEDVLVLDDHTLLVVNDNNFPYGGGRALASDATEFIRIGLPAGLRR